MVAVKVTLTVASTNMRTLVTMSRKGTMLSSPPSSSGAISFGSVKRRILLRCCALRRSGSFAIVVRARSVIAGASLDREQVEHALLRGLEVVLNVLRALVQDEVRDHAGDGDPQSEGRVVH